MNRFFNPDNAFFSFMSRVADLMILNILFIITSIPIVTIGTSLTALDYVTLHMARKEDDYDWKMYLKAWKENFKQSTILFAIMVAVGIFLAFDIRFTGGEFAAIMPFAKQLRYLIFIAVFLYLCMFIYLFALQAQFVNTVGHTLKNALLMAISRLPYTLIMVLILAAPFVLGWFVPLFLPYVGIFFLLMGFAVISRFHAIFFVKAFRPFMPEENEDVPELED